MLDWSFPYIEIDQKVLGDKLKDYKLHFIKNYRKYLGIKKKILGDDLGETWEKMAYDDYVSSK